MPRAGEHLESNTATDIETGERSSLMAVLSMPTTSMSWAIGGLQVTN